MKKILSYTSGAESGKAGTQELKKLSFKKQLIETLYVRGPQTIADLCGPVRVSIPTMAALVNELIKAGWVKQTGIARSRGGRRPALYGINETAKFVAGIEICREYIRMAIFNLNNEPVDPVMHIDKGLDSADDIMKLISDHIDFMLKKNNIKRERILGYGITIPGLIDKRSGISHSYARFGERPIAETFSKLLGGPAYIEHDTKAMAIGESWFGQAKNKSNVLCLNIGSGIGLGIIVNGVLYQGHSGFSGEFGHIQMVQDGALCYCGKIGCLETVASGTFMVKKAVKELGEGKSSAINTIVGNRLELVKLQVIIQAALSGDQYAIELIEEFGEYLARGIATLIHLFNPEAIIIGGDIAPAGKLIKGAIEQPLNKYTMNKPRQDAVILLSELGEKAGLLGTVPLVMTNTFSSGFEFI